MEKEGEDLPIGRNMLKGRKAVKGQKEAKGEDRKAPRRPKGKLVNERKAARCQKAKAERG